MKKSVVLITLVLLCSLPTFAQFSIGARVGLASGDIKGNDLLVTSAADLDTLRLAADKAKVGFRIGLFTRIEIPGNFYVQPEVILRTASRQYEREDVLQGEVSFREENFFHVDIPVLVGAKLGPFRAQAGPVASILLADESDFIDLDAYSRGFDTAEWGFQAGFGLDISNLAIDVVYQANFSNEDGITIGGENFNLDSETGHWVFGVAWIFNK